MRVRWAYHSQLEFGLAFLFSRSLFSVVMERDEVEVHNNAKNRTRPISSHLELTLSH